MSSVLENRRRKNPALLGLFSIVANSLVNISINTSTTPNSVENLIHRNLKIIDMGGSSPTVIRRGDIVNRVNGVTHALLDLNLPSQSTIGVLGVNSVDWIVAWLGIEQAGHISVPLNYRLPDLHFDHCVKMSNLSLVFGDGEFVDRMPANIQYIQFGQPFDDFLNFEPYILPGLDLNRVAHIFYTSGSTNMPKGIVIRYNDKVKSADITRQLYINNTPPGPGFSFLNASPFYHIAGTLAMESILTQAAGLFVLPKFDATTFINVLVKYKISNITLVPSVMSLLLQELENLKHPVINSLVAISLPASAVSTPIRNQIKHYFPNAVVSSSYGMTEITHAIFGNCHPDGLPIPDSSVGYPVMPDNIKLVDNILRIKSLFHKYYQDANTCIDNDGYFITGDIFQVDTDGFYYYVDRADHMFKSGGEKVYPNQVEQTINQHLSVVESAVVKLEDDIKGYKAYAFVVLKNNYKLNIVDIQNYVATHLGTHCVPRQIWALPNLPLGSSNKIDHTLLTKIAKEFVSSPTPLINIHTMNICPTLLLGKIAIVTGATGGVGYAVCCRLAQQGATVIGLVRRDVDRANNMFAQLPNASAGHQIIQADITNTEQIKHSVDQITDRFGKCDILVNTAGSTQAIPLNNLSKLTTDIFNDIININLVSVYSTIREFSELLGNSNDGLIINIGSVVGSTVGGSNLAYAAAKAGVESLTRNLSLALAPRIRVISVSPSYMETGFIPGATVDQTVHEARQTPLGRNVTPDDVAAVVESCATTMTFITGQNIIVDGGRSL